jgi:predicted phage-related endonuclease
MTDLLQGTPEWFADRLGNLTASRMADATATTKTGWGASRANLMAQLIAERLTGVPSVGFQSEAMARGKEIEPQAIAEYEFRFDVEVERVGYVPHPTIPRTGASPDGLIGEDGLIELKSPNTATHIETLMGQNIKGVYMKQMQWQMACTGRKWVDFVSYDPRLPARMALVIERVERDDKMITQLEGDAREFLRELDDKMAILETLYPERIAA